MNCVRAYLTKQEVAEYRHRHYEDNKGLRKEQNSKWHMENKERMNERSKTWYENNKEEVNKRRLEKVECDICGCQVINEYLKRHQETTKCKAVRKVYNFIHS